MLVRLAILGLILTAVGAAIIYTWWQDEDAPLATLRDGSGLLLFTGTADEVVAAASREIGFTVHPIRQPDYALVGIQLQPHPAEVPHGLDMVTLAYETKLTRGKPGRGAVEVYQAPVVFDSPMNGPFGGEPEPVELGVPGGRAVKIPFDGGRLGYTVWGLDHTSHVIFNGPQPSEEAVLEALRSLAR